MTKSPATTEPLLEVRHLVKTFNPGTAVVPLENAGAWVRVDASGRRGWIPSSALTE